MHVSKLAKEKSIWCPRADSRTVRFARKMMSMDRVLRPLITLGKEPMSAAQLLEKGVGYMDSQLEFLGFVVRERDEAGHIAYRLTERGENVRDAVIKMLKTIEENLPKGGRGGASICEDIEDAHARIEEEG